MIKVDFSQFTEQQLLRIREAGERGAGYRPFQLASAFFDERGFDREFFEQQRDRMVRTLTDTDFRQFQHTGITSFWIENT